MSFTDDARAIFRMMTLRESIASVALSHGEACRCDACLATAGDFEAFMRVAERVQELKNDEGPP